jgi:8-oxo-dGTP pyrophosphatase MutT (NUDIX family)
MNLGETYIETAARETFEEAGVDIRIITQLPHVVLTRGSQRKIVVPFLATQTCDREPKSDHAESEVVDAQWFDVEALPPLYTYQQPIFDAALLLLRQ